MNYVKEAINSDYLMFVDGIKLFDRLSAMEDSIVLRCCNWCSINEMRQIVHLRNFTCFGEESPSSEVKLILTVSNGKLGIGVDFEAYNELETLLMK